MGWQTADEKCHCNDITINYQGHLADIVAHHRARTGIKWNHCQIKDARNRYARNTLQA